MPVTRAADRRSSAAGLIAAVAAVALGVLSLVLSEGLIVAAVAFLGPAGAFAVLFAGLSAASLVVAYAFDAEDARRGLSPVLSGTRRWIDRTRAAAEARAARLAHLSEWVAFVVLSVTAGPLVTTIALKIRGGVPRTGYLLSVASSALFAAVWVTVYAGGLAAVRQALNS